MGGKCAENGIEFCHRIGHFVVAGFGGKEILTGLDGSCPWLRKLYGNCPASSSLAHSGLTRGSTANRKISLLLTVNRKGGAQIEGRRGSETKSDFFLSQVKVFIAIRNFLGRGK